MEFNMNNQNQKLDDKTMMDDSLRSENQITANYDLTANECATPNVKTEVLNILNEEHQIQGEIFNEIQSRGWYPVEAAEQQKIAKAKQKFQSQS